ncbi:MAG: MBL fold metallo-hydrolase [Candidatus Latescibacteria bacterium]|nr:MBL fold metallo-hydrolase [Candidatus Latescibacterota bacterium]
MRITTHIYVVGSEQFGLSHPLDCNCYLIDGGTDLALIDAGLGLGVEDICAHVRRDGFDPARISKVIITHAHLGHWGGAPHFRDMYGAKVWVSTLGAERLRTLNDPGLGMNRRFNRYPQDFIPRPCPVDGEIRDGDRLVIGAIELQAIHVQGHTKDSICFLMSEDGNRALFSGDTVFYGGRIGLLNMEGCDLDDYRRDIHKLADLSIDMLLPGHGVFVLSRGQKHINRAIRKLSDFVLPESFFEMNEFMWDREYLQILNQ